MLMPASPEFITLCQSQIAVLTHSLGASLSVVYLTEEFTDALDAKLIPLVAYPEAAATWDLNQILELFSVGMVGVNPNVRLLTAESSTARAESSPLLPTDTNLSNTASSNPEEMRLSQQQVVLPLIHEGVMMGLLVTARSDRAWRDREQTQIERIAKTLSLACVLDQRGQWLDQDLRQQRQLQAQQHDIFDDLLHQFRNPLTALRTFGKLMLKRLLPGDPNREVAAGIVRESDRLQGLLQQFDAAIDLGEANLLPPASTNARVTGQAQLESRSQPEFYDAALHSQPTGLLTGASLLTGTPLHLEPYFFAEALEPLLSSAEAIAQDRQLELRVYLPPELPPVQTDIRVLREVLNNLIDNALKYTPLGGKVYIKAGIQRSLNQKNRQGLVIADTGPGIPPQDVEHLFERHYRGVQAQTEVPGSGLGLAIAHDLITQMQGEIQVFSPAQTSGLLEEFPTRAGTAFVVWLPEG